MTLEALERRTGSYGTVNAGDTVTVTDSHGEELLSVGGFKKVDEANDTATPEAVVAHNESGLNQEPIHADGTNRDILNTDGRVLHESGPELIAESAARVEAEVEPFPIDVPASGGDGEVTAKKKKTA